MKRFSHAIGMILLVLLLTLSLSGCATTAVEQSEVQKVEPVAEVVVQPVQETKTQETKTQETKAPAEEAKVQEEVVATSEQGPEVYPYGVKVIEKNNSGDNVFDLFIVHTNDVHGRIEPSKSSIGYSKLSTLLNTARRITDNILLLDAGDTLHGTTLANLSKGEVPAVLLDMLQYDAISPGNHDYNFGTERLVEIDNTARVFSDLKVLSANTLDKNGYLVFQPYQIYDFNGFKVSVIGLTTPDTKTKSHPKNTENVTFDSDVVIKNAQLAVDMLHEISDYVIVLGHIGTVDDGAYSITSPMIAKNVKGIDLFVDGHSHTVLPEGLKVDDTLIVQAGEYLKYVGVVQVRVENNKVKFVYPFLISASDVNDPANSALAQSVGVIAVPEDARVKAYVDSEKAKMDKHLNKVVARIPMNLEGARENVRTRSTNLGRLLARAMSSESGADFSITNGGGIRASISRGDVTVKDINTVLPFNNLLTVVELTGDEVYQVMEQGYSKLPETNGGFTQTDLSVRYDKNAPVGSRIKSLLLNGKELDRNKVYKVASNDFLTAGGDGYDLLKKPIMFALESLEEVLANYLNGLYAPMN